MDPYNPLGPVGAWLSRSFRVGYLFGIEIRVFWTVFLVFGYTAWQFLKWPGVGSLAACAVGLLFVGLLYAVVLAHEFGHVFVGRRFHMGFPLITLSALGGLAHGSSPAPGPKQEIAVALAGPATHLVWIGLAHMVHWFIEPMHVGTLGLQLDVVQYVIDANVAMLLFNLLPCYPMDGGRVLRGLLALKRHPNWATLWAARVGAIGAVGFIAWGLSRSGLGGTLLIFIGLSNLFACVRELTAVKYSEGPYGGSIDPWQLDPEGWKTGSWRVDDDRPRRLGWFRRWRMRRLARVLDRPNDATRRAGANRPPDRLRSAEDDRPAEEGELDRLLDRVRDVGMSGLSERERDRLRTISETRRGR